MKIITKDELHAILSKHKKWLLNEDGGEMADLSGANLSRANLSRADLSRADLSGANLSGAYLSRAYLSGANLSGAYLSEAYLSGANLSGANLSGADLSGANLSGAYLSEAYLSRADLSGADLSRANAPLSCPDTGSFVGWKKAHGVIVKIRITEDAKRSSATGRKCRCSKAEVLSIENMNGSPFGDIQVESDQDAKFIYRVGETVEVPDFDECRWNECSTGIHFFITRQEAVDY